MLLLTAKTSFTTATSTSVSQPGSPRGLVIPILRDAEQMSIADIEQAIVDYAKKAKDGKTAIEDLTGGTFSITNGGTFGSMMSTRSSTRLNLRFFGYARH